MSLGRVWLGMALTVALVSAGIVVAAAFTSEVVNVTARLEQPPTIIKHPLDPPPLTPAEVDAITQDAIGLTGCQQGDLEFPYEVPGGTCLWWALRVSVRNNYYDPLVDLLITDVFAGDLDGALLPEVPVHVAVLSLTQGQAGQTSLADRVEIDWCVTADLQNGTCVPGGQLEPGADAHMDVLMFTKPNSLGQQEFVAAGTYTVNGGPSAQWTDPEGVLCVPLADCPTALPMQITVASAPAPSQPAATPEPLPTPTPEPIPTAEPTPTVEPTAMPELTPEPTPSPAP